MKRQLLIISVITFLIASAGPLKAGVPLNNLQGVGGIAFNPLAYPAGQNAKEGNVSQRLSNPQFGGWYVKLSKAHVDWVANGVAETIGKRVELSYGYEVIAVNNGPNVHKNNLGAKVLLLPENNGGNKAIPAISIGTIWKHTSLDPGVGKEKSDFDIYLVATKLITQTSKPILLSGGLLDTSELVTGVFGFDSDRKLTFFGNVDVLPLSNLALGLEYKQGAKFSDFKNASYWDAHAAWFVNKNVTLVGAFVNAGDINSTTKVGLGNGFVLSAQYAF
jgi:hypothetical protein